MTLSGGHGEPTRTEVPGSAVAGIVHDINNELTMVLNHVAMGGLETLHAAGARNAVARCAALTNGLLAYCRSESLKLLRIDPTSLLKEFASGLTLPDTLQLNVVVPAESPKILANAAALRQILNNLILNARESIDDAGTITLSLSGYIMTVEDSGPGITAINLTNIFQHFFTTKGKSRAGLGLSVVRELMQQQGGSVTVTSKPGKTIFELRFRG